MSLITIKQASEIIGKTKRTLMRWDEEGKFNPDSRQEHSNYRLYEKERVENLKILLEHEKYFRKNLIELHIVQEAVSPYSRRKWLSKREEDLLKKETKLIENHKKLMREFEKFSPEIKQLYKQFFMRKK